MSLKIISVSCAIIVRTDHVFLAQRPPTKSQGLKWEFPGGKIEKGESPKAALKREILEELGADVKIYASLASTSWQHDSIEDLVIKLHPFVCQLQSERLVLREHIDSCWLKPENIIGNIDLSEADIPIVEQLIATSLWRSLEC
jgi:8-oxo-dGTP diphosphatase